MNRAQRRAAERTQRRHQPVAQKLESGPLHIQHGHTDNQVIIKFTRVTDHLLLTPQQTDDFIKAVLNSKQQLADHQRKGGKLSG